MTTTRSVLAGLLIIWGASCASAAPPAPAEEHRSAALESLAARTEGILAACVVDDEGASCVNGDRPSSMQSVMKLVVALATLDAVERGEFTLADRVTLTRSDVSVFVQPIEGRLGLAGYTTTIEELARGAVIQSDSMATDWLIARLGGPMAVQAFLERKGVKDIRLDRDERHLQTEIFGLTWREAYTDPDRFQADIDAQPEAVRDAAFAAYLGDARDTATPRAMATLLYRLAKGQLLDATSTAWMLSTMKETQTFPDRLRAGTAPDWQVAHKTGTSNTWKGVTGATNDVGVLTSPAGKPAGVAVFLAASPAGSRERAAAIASVARIATGTH
jgi:beta-lactamase class A